MKLFDKFIRYLRVSKAINEITYAETVLDLGGYDFYLLNRLQKKYRLGILVDPLASNYTSKHLISVGGDIFYARENLPIKNNSVDIIFMLSVFEHLGENKRSIIDECYKMLKNDGRIILTVPSPRVDRILSMLKYIYLIDGMSLEQHGGFAVSKIDEYFDQSFFRKVRHIPFQFGLNNLFIYNNRE
ncbi:MAG: methyltransferase domain-containing protein [Thermodesulfobacteriota bacterium]